MAPPNGTAPPLNAPPWVKWLGYLIKEVGLSTMVVVFLLGQNAGYIPSPYDVAHKDILKVLGQNQQILVQNQEHIVRQQKIDQAMCLNGAHGNALQEARCRVD